MNVSPQLSALRRKIDAADRALLSILAKRMQVSKAIGRLKQKSGTAALDAKRLQEIMRTRSVYGKSKKLSVDFVKKCFKLIHQESLNVQKRH